MYHVESWQTLVTVQRRIRSRTSRRVVSRTVLMLGLTSLFTDISSEMVSTILPLYLVYSIGLTPLQFGAIDGLYQGAGAFIRVFAGFAGDRWRRHKEVAWVGYALSAACKPLLIAAGGMVGFLSAVIVVDRTGKGIRTAPRDAMISLSTERSDLGTAFGVHRALDTCGAMLGPFLAFFLLGLAPGRFDVVFVVSFCVALIGLAIITLFVDNPQTHPEAAADDAVEPEREAPVSMGAAARLLGLSRFRLLVIVGSALGLVTMSDGFVYLALQRRQDLDPQWFPLLYVGTSIVYMLLAVPFGRLADRVGRGRVFLGGYALLLLVYAALLVPDVGTLLPLFVLVMFGAYYAATDGVLMAFASPELPEPLRGTGLSLVVTGTSGARLVASIAFGAIWTAWGLQTAVTTFAVGLVVVLFGAAIALRLARRPAVV
jgi:MFS family permease